MRRDQEWVFRQRKRAENKEESARADGCEAVLTELHAKLETVDPELQRMYSLDTVHREELVRVREAYQKQVDWSCTKAGVS